PSTARLDLHSFPTRRSSDLKTRRGASAITMMTAYDCTMARLVDEANVDAVLVGDSLGMVVQGLSNTLTVTLDEVCYHGRAVARGDRKSTRLNSSHRTISYAV